MVWHQCPDYFRPVCVYSRVLIETSYVVYVKCWQLSNWICLPLRCEYVVTVWKMSVCVSVQSLNTKICLFVLNSSSMSILLIVSEWKWQHLEWNTSVSTVDFCGQIYECVESWGFGRAVMCPELHTCGHLNRQQSFCPLWYQTLSRDAWSCSEALHHVFILCSALPFLTFSLEHG